jgi:FKBP-type peptidyl-prolyl cis-trans isomerase
MPATHIAGGPGVPGFGEGLLLTPEGGMIELEISPQLYGRNASIQGAPVGATLHYLVEVFEIVK